MSTLAQGVAPSGCDTRLLMKRGRTPIQCSLCRAGRFPGMLIFQTTLGVRCCYYPHFFQ